MIWPYDFGQLVCHTLVKQNLSIFIDEMKKAKEQFTNSDVIFKWYTLILVHNSLSGSYWIRISHVPKADSTIVQLHLMGVANLLFLHLFFSDLFIFTLPQTTWQASFIGFSAWLGHLVWAGPIRTQVHLCIERLLKPKSLQKILLKIYNVGIKPTINNLLTSNFLS